MLATTQFEACDARRAFPSPTPIPNPYPNPTQACDARRAFPSPEPIPNPYPNPTQACDARRAFPCLDEPARRSVVVISLVVPPGCLGLSNMNVVSSSCASMAPSASIILWPTRRTPRA